MQEKWFCEYCQEYHGEEVERIEVDGAFYCEDAIGNEIFQCMECGGFFTENDINKDEFGNIVCDQCFDDYNYVWCEYCGELTRVEDASEVTGSGNRDGWYCSDCIDNWAYFCDYCEEYHHIDTWHATAQNGCDICECALEDGEYEYCAGCGCYFKCDYLNWDENSEEYYCDSCYSDIRGFIRSYHNYPSDYSIIFSRGKERQLLLHIGMELEIDGGGEDEDHAHEILDEVNNTYEYNFIAMSDGSLNDGFEIISQPRTLEDHLSGDWEYICKQALNLGYESHNPGTCGLHFHLDRKYFDGVENYEERLSLLVIQLEDFLKVFSRRRYYNYCEFKKINSAKKKELNELCKYKNENKGHYSALNFSRSNTIEVRFCRGTLKYNTIVASLQLMQILANITKYCNINEIALLSDDIIRQVASDRKYTEILKYMDERGL